MLLDPLNDVRLAAGTYIARYPTPEAAETLSDILPNERDRQARKQIAKAIKACQSIRGVAIRAM